MVFNSSIKENDPSFILERIDLNMMGYGGMRGKVLGFLTIKSSGDLDGPTLFVVSTMFIVLLVSPPLGGK